MGNNSLTTPLFEEWHPAYDAFIQEQGTTYVFGLEPKFFGVVRHLHNKSFFRVKKRGIQDMEKIWRPKSLFEYDKRTEGAFTVIL